jgi:hypothetical protein
LARIETKNIFSIGDEIEIVNPDGVKKMKVEKIFRTTINHGVQKS